MKRLFNTIVILSVLFIIFQIGVKFFRPGHVLTYKFNTNKGVVKVTETFNFKGDVFSYYFDLETKKGKYDFQIFKNYSRADRIIKEVKVIEDEKIECVLPVFIGGDILLDAICMNEDKYFYYKDIKGASKIVDDYFNNLKLKKYSSTTFSDVKVNPKLKGNIKYYKDNLPNNNFVWLYDYKGVLTLNNQSVQKITPITLFKNDTYKRELQTTVGRYYLTADYDKDIEFSKFYLVDLFNNSVKSFYYSKPISFDSYVQGTYDNSVYLVDRDNKRQYRVNTRTKKVVEVGNKDIGMLVLEGGLLVRKNDSKLFNKDVVFTKYKTYHMEGYHKIYDLTSEGKGYIYQIKKENQLYKVYKKAKDSDMSIYLFNTDNINEIKFHNDSVYFYKGSSLKFYSDKTGERTLVTYPEIEFNKNMKFGFSVK